MAECKDRDPLLVTAQWRGTALRVVVRAAKGPAAAGLPATAFLLMGEDRHLDLASVRESATGGAMGETTAL